MAAPLSQVFFPSGFQELFSAWNRFPDAVIYAGGTELVRNQGRRIPLLPRNIISLDKLEDLRKISRTERYLEIGAMVRLSQIIHLGKIVPEILTRCIECMADPQLRNLATIGGILCNPTGSFGGFAPMIALDAQYELRTAQSSRWMGASRFSSASGSVIMAPQELLTRIRVPLDPWTFTSYRRFQTPGRNGDAGTILFIMRNEKNILTDVRVVYSGQIILRDKDSENMLSGKLLPLDPRDAAAFTDRWRNYLSGITEDTESSAFSGKKGNFNPDLLKAQIINFIETTIRQISD